MSLKFGGGIRFCGGLWLAFCWLALSAAHAQITTNVLGTTALWLGPSAGVSSVVLGVSSPTNTWTATPNATGLHLDAVNQSGVGSANVIFSCDANAGATRSGTLSIAGLTLTVTQAGSTYVAAGALTALVSTGLRFPNGVAVDGAGNVYIADTFHNRILLWIRLPERKLSPPATTPCQSRCPPRRNCSRRLLLPATSRG